LLSRALITPAVFDLDIMQSMDPKAYLSLARGGHRLVLKEYSKRCRAHRSSEPIAPATR